MDEYRSLRREIYILKNSCIDIADRVENSNVEAALAIQRARNALFEAWTILCNPPAEDEDH